MLKRSIPHLCVHLHSIIPNHFGQLHWTFQTFHLKIKIRKCVSCLGPKQTPIKFLETGIDTCVLYINESSQRSWCWLLYNLDFIDERITMGQMGTFHLYLLLTKRLKMQESLCGILNGASNMNTILDSVIKLNSAIAKMAPSIVWGIQSDLYRRHCLKHRCCQKHHTNVFYYH